MTDGQARRISWILFGLLAALVLFDWLFIGHGKPKFPWHHVPGYAAVIGLLGCIVVVKLSKALGKAFLQGPERDD